MGWTYRKEIGRVLANLPDLKIRFKKDKIPPDDKVKLWENEHDDAQESGDSSVYDWGKHLFQGQDGTLLPATYTSNKALKNNKIRNRSLIGQFVHPVGGVGIA